MSKTVVRLDIIIRVVFVVLLAFLLLFPGINYFVLLFFVPIATWYVWRLQDRTRDLERRIASLEGPKKPEQG